MELKPYCLLVFALGHFRVSERWCEKRISQPTPSVNRSLLIGGCFSPGEVWLESDHFWIFPHPPI